MQQNKIVSDQASGGDNTQVVANQETQITQMETSLENQTTQINEQVDLKDLVGALFELVARLDFLPMIKGVSADIRVTPLSTPNMSNLGTLTNQAQFGGYSANQQIPSLVNMTAQANIDNIVIS